MFSFVMAGHLNLVKLSIWLGLNLLSCYFVSNSSCLSFVPFCIEYILVFHLFPHWLLSDTSFLSSCFRFYNMHIELITVDLQSLLCYSMYTLGLLIQYTSLLFLPIIKKEDNISFTWLSCYKYEMSQCMYF